MSTAHDTYTANLHKIYDWMHVSRFFTHAALSAVCVANGFPANSVDGLVQANQGRIKKIDDGYVVSPDFYPVTLAIE